MRKNILRIMLGSIIFDVVLVCLFILLGDFSKIGNYTLISTGIIFGYSIPCLFYSKIYDKPKYKYIAIIGSIIVFAAALICILAVWGLFTFNDTFAKTVGTLDIFIVMMAIVSWILSYAYESVLFKVFQIIGISSSAILSVCITIAILKEKFPEGFLFRLYAVLLVLLVGSLVCIGIMNRINTKNIGEKSDNR